MYPQNKYGESSVIELFFQFMMERHSIFVLRYIQNEEPPWTEDEVLLNFKFTNIYRELDRGTVYLLENFLDIESDEELLWNIFIYRWFNRVDTTVNLGGPEKIGEWNWKEFYSRLTKINETKHPVFTNAHMVTGVNFSGQEWGRGVGTKIKNYVWLCNEMRRNIRQVLKKVQECSGIQELWKYLMSQKGCGAFIAYEIAIDINYTRLVNFDENEWANPGPGCQRGINWIFSNVGESWDLFGDVEDTNEYIRGLNSFRSKEEYVEIMRYLVENQDEFFEEFAGNNPSDFYPFKKMTMRNIEHSLCEFQKYFKALTGCGRPKCTFQKSSLSPVIYDDKLLEILSRIGIKTRR
jgi:hypothetical protein